MEDSVPFGSGLYLAVLGVLAFARGMDFLSTRVATPTLALEGNPLAKKLGWKWGGLVNVGLCLGCAHWPLAAIVIATASVLVAAHNFQNAWLMRTLGEDGYSIWYAQRIRETSTSLYVSCVLAQSTLIASVGGAMAWFGGAMLIPTAIGWGIISYAGAVAFYTLLSVWRLRRFSR